MQLTLSTVLLVLTTLVAAAPQPKTSLNERALGINCRGSGFCGGNHLGKIHEFINTINEGRQYYNGQHIACVETSLLGNGECAFLQGTANGLSGHRIKSLMQSLVDHKCKDCGSVPINFPASNDPGAGILTVNYVKKTDNPCGTQLCP